MDPRKRARIVGILFIIGTLTPSISVLLTEPILDDPDYLSKVSENENQIIMGGLLVLIMSVAVAFIPVMLYPILKRHNENLALGYVVFRTLEVVTYLFGLIGLLLLLTLSQEYVNAGAPDAPYFHTLGSLLREASGLLVEPESWVSLTKTIVFGLTVLILNYALFKSRLIPRGISVFGLLAGTIHLAEGLMSMFGLLPAGAGTVLGLPIFVQEMVFAVWLIAKGFNSSAIAAEP